MAQQLLATRRDIFPNETLHDFRGAFDGHVPILKQEAIDESVRTLFHMK